MMAAMTEMTEDPVLGGAVEPAETVTHETSLTETFENPLEFLQHVEPTEPAAPEETDGTEKPEQEDRQQAEERDTEEDGQKDTLRDGEKDNQQDTLGDGEKDRQQDTQRDGEKDRQQDTQEDRQQAEETNGQPDGRQEGQTVRQPAAESSIKESKWVMGSQCRAVWSEDGRVYPATVLSVDGERCRVFFNGYGNQEDVDVSALTSPVAVVPQPATQNSKDWKPGSVCRAVFSEDGLVYPAVVLWVKGQRCRVRFDNYNNEEEKDVGSLLRHNELHGSGRPPAAKGSNWQSSVTSSNSDWKSRGDENQGERGGGDGKREARGGERRSTWKDEEQNSSWVKDKQSDQGHTQMEEEEKKRGNKADKPTYHSSSFFPPFPPPPPLQPGSADSVSFVPPPPPLWQFSSTAAADSSSSMLMLWYMCGFHTGSYMAQQGFKSNSKD